MKTSELVTGLQVVTIGSNPVVGFIVSVTCLSGKNEKRQGNVFVKIRKLNGIITYATADLIKPFKSF